MTEEIVMPAGNLYPATGLDLEQAAMVEFLAIGAHAVRRTELKAGAGACWWSAPGRSGSAPPIFAKIAGGDVTRGRCRGRQDSTRPAPSAFARSTSPSSRAQAFRAEEASGFDAVLDATGSIRADERLAVPRPQSGGDYTLVGVIKGDLVWPDPEVHRRELTIRGSRNATREDFEHVMDSIRRGLRADRRARDPRHRASTTSPTTCPAGRTSATG